MNEPWFSEEAARSAEEYRKEQDNALEKLIEERRERRLHVAALTLAVIGLTVSHAPWPFRSALSKLP